MRKMRLEIDALAVESFVSTEDASKRSGSVRGAESFEEEFYADSAATCGCPLKPEVATKYTYCNTECYHNCPTYMTQIRCCL